MVGCARMQACAGVAPTVLTWRDTLLWGMEHSSMTLACDGVRGLHQAR